MLKENKIIVILLKITLIGSIILIATGCSPGTAAETQVLPVSPTGVAEMTQPMPSPIPTAQSLIEQARADLAERLSVSITEIDLVEATEVEWSDSSLDCPQPGIDYLQVVTPGYRILLGVNGQVYEYHSNRDTDVIFCENPDSPVLPKP